MKPYKNLTSQNLGLLLLVARTMTVMGLIALLISVILLFDFAFYFLSFHIFVEAFNLSIILIVVSGLLAALVETSIGKNGYKAADAAIRTFTQTLQKQDLPFNIMSHSKVISNAQFTALYHPASTTETKTETGFLGKFISNVTSDKSIGAAPTKMNQYGLVTAWTGNSALTNKGGENNYIKKSIEALKVDAVLVINDIGFSFSCEACIGAGGAMNGAASTGSAFNATLVTRSGPVMNIREWFATTDEQGAMVAGIVNPTEHKVLFEEHGRKMARVFAAATKESLMEKK